jgi:hypothetical protein
MVARSIRSAASASSASGAPYRLMVKSSRAVAQRQRVRLVAKTTRRGKAPEEICGLRRVAKTTRRGKAEGRRAKRVKRVGVGPHAP